LSCAAGYSLSV